MAFLDLPIGTIVAWENDSIPSGWAVCDGTNGTPDLRDRFPYGAAIDGDVRVTGGNDAHTHTNSNTSARTTHNHGGSKATSVAGAESVWVTTGTGGTAATDGHSHSATVAITGADTHSHTLGSTGSGSNLPSYIKRVFIRRNS